MVLQFCIFCCIFALLFSIVIILNFFLHFQILVHRQIVMAWKMYAFVCVVFMYFICVCFAFLHVNDMSKYEHLSEIVCSVWE